LQAARPLEAAAADPTATTSTGSSNASTRKDAEAAKKDKGGSAGPVTKEQYIAKAKAQAEKKGETFDQAKTEAKFTKADTNSDGTLSAEEQAAAGGGKKKKKGAE